MFKSFVQSCSYNQISIRLGMSDFTAGLRILLSGDNIKREVCLREMNLAERIDFINLPSGSKFSIRVTAGEWVEELTAETLVKPEGICLGSWAVIGDPHISFTCENRGGRLHREGPVLLREMVERAIELGAETILITGDLTNAATDDEYRFAAELLRRYPIRFLNTPGNHDYLNDGKSKWLKNIGVTAWYECHNGIQFAGLDTGDGLLNKPENIAVINQLDSGLPAVLISHYQIFPDHYIKDNDRAIKDHESAKDLIQKLSALRGISYVGHKNIATEVQTGNLLQINVPQPLHFPCGMLLCERYRNGVYHKFEPIFSEILNEYSRLGINACGGSSEFRERFSQNVWNQVVSC